MTPPLKTNKTQTKNWREKKLTLIWLKWSPIAPFTSIFSQKYIYIAGKGPRTPICRREHDPDGKHPSHEPKSSISALFMAPKRKFKKKELTCVRQNKKVANCTFSTSIKNHQVGPDPICRREHHPPCIYN